MNFSSKNISDVVIESSLEDININIPKRGEDLTSIGVFISGILLSIGGLVAILFSSFKASRCITIDCGCSKCTRKLPDVLEEVEEIQ